MADGRTHNAMLHNMTFLVYVTAPLWLFLGSRLGWVYVTTAAIATLAGYRLALYVSPDLDLLGLSVSEGLLLRRYGILGLLVVMWFMPYAYVMRFVGFGRKGHRNFFSHFPGVGTLIRHRWLFLPADVVLLWSGSADLQTVYLAIMVGLLLGGTIADTIHYIADFYPRRIWKHML